MGGCLSINDQRLPGRSVGRAERYYGQSNIDAVNTPPHSSLPTNTTGSTRKESFQRPSFPTIGENDDGSEAKKKTTGILVDHGQGDESSPPGKQGALGISQNNSYKLSRMRQLNRTSESSSTDLPNAPRGLDQSIGITPLSYSGHIIMGGGTSKSSSSRMYSSLSGSASALNKVKFGRTLHEGNERSRQSHSDHLQKMDAQIKEVEDQLQAIRHMQQPKKNDTPIPNSSLPRDLNPKRSIVLSSGQTVTIDELFKQLEEVEPEAARERIRKMKV